MAAPKSSSSALIEPRDFGSGMGARIWLCRLWEQLEARLKGHKRSVRRWIACCSKLLPQI
eukprot:scaffold128702_cov49-Prasinocladus_malaysianus.AAC.2